MFYGNTIKIEFLHMRNVCSIKNEHSAYDMFYAVLARRNNSVLVSNDSELLNIAKEMKIESFG
jgi:predicted nucleic acid-binding protein